jgi:hypothetical protein
MWGAWTQVCGRPIGSHPGTGRHGRLTHYPFAIIFSHIGAPGREAESISGALISNVYYMLCNIRREYMYLDILHVF